MGLSESNGIKWGTISVVQVVTAGFPEEGTPIWSLIVGWIWTGGGRESTCNRSLEKQCQEHTIFSFTTTQVSDNGTVFHNVHSIQSSFSYSPVTGSWEQIHTIATLKRQDLKLTESSCEVIASLKKDKISFRAKWPETSAFAFADRGRETPLDDGIEEACSGCCWGHKYVCKFCFITYADVTMPKVSISGWWVRARFKETKKNPFTHYQWTHSSSQSLWASSTCQALHWTHPIPQFLGDMNPVIMKCTIWKGWKIDQQ